MGLALLFLRLEPGHGRGGRAGFLQAQARAARLCGVSTHVVTIQKARSAKVNELVAILTQVLPDSLAHDGCEAIHHKSFGPWDRDVS